MKNLFLIICSLLLGVTVHAQTLTQRIRGKVIDAETREPLYGARVEIANTSPSIGAQTDEQGIFVIEEVPVGRRAIKITFIGYSDFIRDNLNVNSTREYQMEDIALRPGLELDEVVVSAYQGGDAVNEFQVMSVKRLDPEELQYHAATGNDPSRLVQGLPGYKMEMTIGMKWSFVEMLRQVYYGDWRALIFPTPIIMLVVDLREEESRFSPHPLLAARIFLPEPFRLNTEMPSPASLICIFGWGISKSDNIPSAPECSALILVLKAPYKRAKALIWPISAILHLASSMQQAFT